MKVNHRIHLCLAKMSPSGAEQKYINEAFPDKLGGTPWTEC